MVKVTYAMCRAATTSCDGDAIVLKKQAFFTCVLVPEASLLLTRICSSLLSMALSLGLQRSINW